MELCKYGVILLLVTVIDVSKAQICSNSTYTTESCCLCTEEQCEDIVLSGFYKLDLKYVADTNCTLGSTTPSPSYSTDDGNTKTLYSTPSVSGSTDNGVSSTPGIQNYTFYVRNCPQGFYVKDNETCEKCPEPCLTCNNINTCIECLPDFENNSVKCSQITTTTQAPPPSKVNVIAIGAGVSGGVVLIVIVIIIVVVVMVRKRRRKQFHSRKRTFTEKLEATRNRATDFECEDVEDDVEVGKTEPHIYENTAQLQHDFSNSIQQSHDKVLRYTPDPTQSSNLKINKENETSDLDELPFAPAPPPQAKSKRTTKKVTKPELVTEDVYEPVGEVDGTDKDSAESLDGENYENQKEVEKLKSRTRKMSLQQQQTSPEDHVEDDYENEEILKDLKKEDSEPEQWNRERPEPEVEEEHQLQDYENEMELLRLREPTKDPLAEEQIYENF